MTGAPRSGTTWVGRTISESNNVLYIHEPFNLHSPKTHIDLGLKHMYTCVDYSDQKVKIYKRLSDFLAFQQSSSTTEHVTNNTTYHNLATRYLFKDPIALLSAGWFYRNFNFKVICMIRNPLAFIGSLKKAGWDIHFENFSKQKELISKWLSPFQYDIIKRSKGEGDFLDRGILLWNILHFVIHDYRARYPEWFFVRHEDIAKNPLFHFEKIFEFIHQEFDNETIQYIYSFTSDDNPVEAIDYTYQARASMRSLETWKKRLSPKEIMRIKNGTWEVAKHFYNESFQD